MSETIRVRVPCTSANLGPGFDCFGIALTRYTVCEFTETKEGLTFTDVEDRYCNENNLAVQAYFRTLKEMGLPAAGLHTRIETEIPIARGLGSSAALIAAGVKAANAAHGNPLGNERMLKIATEIEGHPDNVAPALLGGLTASMMQDGQVYSVSCPLSEKWQFCAMIPNFPLSTAKARSVLPGQVTLQDAVFNASHAALTLQALRTGDGQLLGAALRDRLHQPYRRPLIEDFDEVEEAAKRCGADAVCISGAGPTVMCIGTDAGFADRMLYSLRGTRHEWTVAPLKVDHQGACVEMI